MQSMSALLKDWCIQPGGPSSLQCLSLAQVPHAVHVQASHYTCAACCNPGCAGVCAEARTNASPLGAGLRARRRTRSRSTRRKTRARTETRTKTRSKSAARSARGKHRRTGTGNERGNGKGTGPETGKERGTGRKTGTGTGGTGCRPGTGRIAPQTGPPGAVLASLMTGAEGRAQTDPGESSPPHAEIRAFSAAAGMHGAMLSWPC